MESAGLEAAAREEGDVHRAPGVPFVQPHGFVCHLGSLLSATTEGLESARTRLFNARVGAMRVAAKHWSGVQLTFMGRVHVAKQVLHPIAIVNATFLPPSRDQMWEWREVVSRFVCRGSCAPKEDGGMLRFSPSIQVASLPWEEGGIALMDVDVQLDAMWCKTIARLMHPQKHPWKVFMERQITGWAGAGEGVRAVLSRARPVNNALPARLQMYIRAFRALAPHRMQPAETISFWSVMAESLLLNQQVPDHRHPGLLLSGSSVVGRALRGMGIMCMHHLREAVLDLGHPRHDVVRVLPHTWQEHVRQPLDHQSMKNDSR